MRRFEEDVRPEDEEVVLNMEENENAEAELEEEKETRMRYDESGLDERIIRAVKDKGFEFMSPIQEAAIPVMIEGGDIIGQAQTGTGKTAAFGIPVLSKVNPSDRKLQAVILCPTRELAMQAAEDIRDFAKYMHGIKVLSVYGGQDISRQIRALSSGVQIVVGTPGRVMDHMRRHTMKMENVKVLVLDEADEMLDMGFRDDIETILAGLPEEGRQTALFSATMPEPIMQITKKYQHDAKFIKMTPKEITVAAIEQTYYRVAPNLKQEALCRLIDFSDPKKALVFCNTKRMVDQLAQILKDRGYQADGLHGDLSQNQRDTVMNLFRSGRINILIATDVAARGIDVSGVEAVFNYDIPDDIEYYVHRIGRTGRAGRSGKSYTLVTGREMYKLRQIERICHTKIDEEKIPTAKAITKTKARKIYAQLIDTIENNDLVTELEYINSKVDEGEYSAEQLAAAFMRISMGEEIEEIKFEDARPPRRFGRDDVRRDGSRGYRGRGGRDGRGDRDGRSRDFRGREGRDGRGRDFRSKDGRDGKFGRGDRKFDKKFDRKPEVRDGEQSPARKSRSNGDSQKTARFFGDRKFGENKTSKKSDKPKMSFWLDK